jgi:hypothetical protein
LASLIYDQVVNRVLQFGALFTTCNREGGADDWGGEEERIYCLKAFFAEKFFFTGFQV